MKKVQEDWKEEMLQVGVLTNTHGVRGRDECISDNR